jgi:uncharacterized protein YdeI (YjbR/CyaY-like superfamily)
LNPANPKFFTSASALQTWFEKNHARLDEQWIGFHRKATGKGGITYVDALDAALCWGWIDGLRRKIDHEGYMIRFTPRKQKSIWSSVNIRKAEELKKQGRMMPPGLAAFERRDPARSGVYSYEREAATFEPAMVKRFRANANAWAWFSIQPPWYRKVTTWWVVSAKREATRSRRLDQLIECSAAGERLPQVLSPPGKR